MKIAGHTVAQALRDYNNQLREAIEAKLIDKYKDKLLTGQMVDVMELSPEDRLQFSFFAGKLEMIEEELKAIDKIEIGFAEHEKKRTNPQIQ